jgi:signal transduction histidine kinase
VHGLTLLSLFGLAVPAPQRGPAPHPPRARPGAGAERDRLDREVAHRTAELTELARHLQTVREDERAHLARAARRARRAADRGQARRGAHPPHDAHRRAEIDERLKHMSELLDQGIALKRRIIEDLRPSALSNLGLIRRWRS